MIVTQSFCVPKVLKRATKHENRFTHRNYLKLRKEQFKFKPQYVLLTKYLLTMTCKVCWGMATTLTYR